KHLDAPHVMCSDAEINRALRRYRFDRQFRGPRRVPIKTLADFIGLSHETLFQAMRGSVSDRTRAKLSWAIVAIDEGRLSFRRNGQQWKCEITEGIARRGIKIFVFASKAASLARQYAQVPRALDRH